MCAPRLSGGLRALVGAAIALAGPDQAAAIVGGSPASEAAPAAASVMVLTASGGMCTGVVVAPDAVLTAGHCAVGAHAERIHFRDARGGAVFVPVRARAVHPRYDDAPDAHARSIDLALLRTAPLTAPLPAPATLSTAAAPPGTALDLYGYGAAGTAAGRHRSLGQLRRARLRAVAGADADRIWLGAPPGAGRVGACHGDSGGPIAQDGAIVALTAWVKGTDRGKGRCGGLTQGTRLEPQRAWIDATLNGWGAAARWLP